jgi:hypothetical protein
VLAVPRTDGPLGRGSGGAEKVRWKAVAKKSPGRGGGRKRPQKPPELSSAGAPAEESSGGTPQGRRFGGIVEARAWSREHFAAWKASLSTDERNALDAYKAGGSALLNKYLREGDADCRERAEELMGPLDSALKRQAVPEAIVVYRHYSEEQLLRPFPVLSLRQLERLLGLVVADPGYLSTSLLPDNPRRRRLQGRGVVAEIQVPSGTPAACPDLIREVEDEVELLLGRGARLRFVEVRGPGREADVLLEVVL